MGSCTYVLVEEKTARHQLTVAVDNFMCGSTVSCAKGLAVIYGNTTANLNRVTQSSVQVQWFKSTTDIISLKALS